MKILGIDDNDDINKLFKVAFVSSGHEFYYTLSGLEGLNLILNNKFDVVLLDLAMPEFSGADLLKSLENEGLLNKHKIIIVTASTISDKDLEEFKRRGVLECLRKPVDLDELLRRVEEIPA